MEIQGMEFHGFWVEHPVTLVCLPGPSNLASRFYALIHLSPPPPKKKKHHFDDTC